MDGARGHLRLFVGAAAFAGENSAPVVADSPHEFLPLQTAPDPAILANRELIRPIGYRRAVDGLAPFSGTWFEELEQKRYQRHGLWLPAALEFGRHPGESLLLLGPGIGSDAIRYVRTGTPVTVGITESDHADLIRDNLSRHAITARVVDVAGPRLPFPDGTFDVVTWNALYDATTPDRSRVSELFRVLKSNGKVIGLFPAWYDAGYWQDLFLPLQWIYWRRPADPTTGPKTTARQLRGLFAAFTRHRVMKRHLRRSELPHLWRMLPLVFLERLIGRVLVFKALKPLSARTGQSTPLAA